MTAAGEPAVPADAGLSDALARVGGPSVDAGGPATGGVTERLLHASLDALQEAFFIFEAERDDEGEVVDPSLPVPERRGGAAVSEVDG